MYDRIFKYLHTMSIKFLVITTGWMHARLSSAFQWRISMVERTWNLARLVRNHFFR